MPSEASVVRRRDTPAWRTLSTASRSRRTEPSRIMTRMPRRSRSSASPAVIWVVARVHPRRGAGHQPGSARPGRVTLDRLAERPGSVDQRQESLGLRHEPVPVDLPQPEHARVLEESPERLGVEQRLAPARLRREVGDHRSGGIRVNRLNPERIEEPSRPGRAKRGRNLNHLGDQRSETPRYRLAQERRKRHDDIEVRVAVEKARDEHLAADIEPLGCRARQGREVRAHRRDAPIGNRHVPAHDVAGVDVDHVGAKSEQVCGDRAERHVEEAAPVLLPCHAAGPCGVISSDQARRAAQVRRNSAYDRT
jgi:hypothetical protein